MNIRVAKQIVATLPMLGAVDRVEYLDKGYSEDRKYVLWEGDGSRYVLRLSDAELQDRRRREFDLMALHYGSGVPCPEPYAFDVYEQGNCCYTLLEYLQGSNAEEALPGLAEDRQLSIGEVAGRVLRRMHQVPYPSPHFDWPAHRQAKYRRNVDRARDAGLTFTGQDGVEAYVEGSVDLLPQAPARFQHDDFHPANLIIRDGELAGVIDFNRADWGDPIEDFYKVPWFTVPVSVSFARGQVEGYFSGPPPPDFWPRYNLYVAMSILPSLLWGHQEPRSSLRFFEGKAREIVDTHDFVGGGPPTWF